MTRVKILALKKVRARGVIFWGRFSCTWLTRSALGEHHCTGVRKAGLAEGKIVLWCSSTEVRANPPGNSIDEAALQRCLALSKEGNPLSPTLTSHQMQAIPREGVIILSEATMFIKGQSLGRDSAISHQQALLLAAGRACAWVLRQGSKQHTQYLLHGSSSQHNFIWLSSWYKYVRGSLLSSLLLGHSFRGTVQVLSLYDSFRSLLKAAQGHLGQRDWHNYKWFGLGLSFEIFGKPSEKSLCINTVAPCTIGQDCFGLAFWDLHCALADK